jgi:hypothetical protein
MYIYRSTVPSKCLHTKNTRIRRPIQHLGTKWAHQPIYKKYIYIKCLRAPLTVPLEHHRLLLPQAVASLHLLPQEVVAHPLPTPPSPMTVARSSMQQPLLLVVLCPAMVAEPPHTAPGKFCPGCDTICPQAPPIISSPDDGVCPCNQLRLLPKENVMAQHQVHQTGASSLPSLDHLVALWPHHTDVSLPAAVSPVLAGTPPHARKVPHLHMQTNNR